MSLFHHKEEDAYRQALFSGNPLSADDAKNSAYLNEESYGNAMDALNYNMKLDQRDYDRKLQQTLFNREDTAIQRTVADAKAAGVNPLAVLGNPLGAGPQVNSEAPSISMDNMSKGAQRQMMRWQKMSMMSDLALKGAQVADLSASARLKTAQAKDVPLGREHEGKKISLSERELDIKDAAQKAEATYKDRHATVEERNAKTNEFLSAIESQRYDLESQATAQQISESKSRADKISQEIKNLIEERNLTVSENVLNTTKNNLVNVQLAYYDGLIDKIDFDKMMSELEYELDANKVELQKAKNNIDAGAMIGKIVTSVLGFGLFLL